MRKSLVMALVAVPLSILSSSAFAQASGSGVGECDRGPRPGRPDCLGYNPYYAPPGASAPLGYRGADAAGAQSSQPRVVRRRVVSPR